MNPGALVYRPQGARIHHLLAHATARGTGDLARAAEHARRAAELAPRRADYAAAYGTLLVRQGETARGLTCLRRALALAGEDVRVVARVVRALCRAEQWQEARQVVLAARFRWPGCAVVAKLWSDVRFQEVRGRQRRQRAQRTADHEGPTLLRFVPPAPAAGKTFRLDGPASLPAPHFPRSLRFSDQKQA
jgi:hypothetical protein